MPDYISRVPTLLQELLSAVKQGNSEACCKLRELIQLQGGEGSTLTEYQGITKLSGATITFSTNSPLQGTTYTSISLTVISLSTGTVTVTDGHGSTTISYQGYSTSWQGSLNNLTITITGDAVVLISYSAI